MYTCGSKHSRAHSPHPNKRLHSRVSWKYDDDPAMGSGVMSDEDDPRDDSDSDVEDEYVLI